MARKAFYSFHFDKDTWRAGQVRSMGVIEGNVIATGNEWEEVRQKNNTKIQAWIDSQMSGKSVAVILAGSNTAGRKWINYEIDKAWSSGKGVVAVHVHGLLNNASPPAQSAKGGNPLYHVMSGSQRLSSIAKCYDTPYSTSKYVYGHIKENLGDWIEEAIAIRNRYVG